MIQECKNPIVADDFHGFLHRDCEGTEQLRNSVSVPQKLSMRFLEGFHGLLQCDGYQGCNKADDVLLACCSAHARRKF